MFGGCLSQRSRTGKPRLGARPKTSWVAEQIRACGVRSRATVMPRLAKPARQSGDAPPEVLRGGWPGAVAARVDEPASPRLLGAARVRVPRWLLPAAA